MIFLRSTQSRTVTMYQPLHHLYHFFLPRHGVKGQRNICACAGRGPGNEVMYTCTEYIFVEVGGPEISLQPLANVVNWLLLLLLDSHYKFIRWRIVTHGCLVTYLHCC